MAKTATNRARLLLSCGDVQQRAVTPELRCVNVKGNRTLLRASSTGLAGSGVELGTERESLLQVLDEDAHFGGYPSAGGPYGKDWYGSFKRSEKTYHSTFSEFSGEKPCWGLGDPQMLENTHPHLFNIAGSKHSFWDDSLRARSDSKAPRPGRSPFNKNDRSKVIKIVRRFRSTAARDVLGSSDENGHRLRESSRDQSGVWEIP